MLKSRISSKSSQPSPNQCSLTSAKKKRKSLHHLKKDDSHIVLTVDRRVTLVIIDKDMYIEKCMALLNDEEAYHECRDETKSIHSKVVKQILGLKISIGPKFKDEYIEICPPGDNSLPARFWGLTKIHKVNIPFIPIVSACVTST